MKKQIILLIILCTIFLPSVVFAETSGWIAGYSVSSQGFVSDTIFSDAEYVEVGLFIEPWSFPFLTPSVSGGVIFPVVPLDVGAGMFAAELGVELFSIEKHPFEWVLDLDNYYCPMVELRMMLPFSDFSVDSSYLSVELFPLRVKTGSGRFSILSLAYITDSKLNFAGWGVRLFDFRLYLF